METKDKKKHIGQFMCQTLRKMKRSFASLHADENKSLAYILSLHNNVFPIK